MSSNDQTKRIIWRKLLQVLIALVLATAFLCVLWFSKNPDKYILSINLGVWVLVMLVLIFSARKMIGDPPVPGVLRICCGVFLLILGLLGELGGQFFPVYAEPETQLKLVLMLPSFLRTFGAAVLCWGLATWIPGKIKVRETIQLFNDELVKEFREVEESNSFLQSLMKSAPLGILTLNLGNRVIQNNSQASLMLQAGGKSLEDMSIGDLIGKDNRQIVEEALDDVFQLQQQKEIKIEFDANGIEDSETKPEPQDDQNDNKDGRRVFEVFLAPMFSARRVSAALVILRDNTAEELRLQKEAEFARELEAHDKRVRADIELARRYQKNLVQEEFNKHRLKAVSLYEPNFHLSGDFYSVFELDDDHMGLVIGDVSSKGLGAAVRSIAMLTLCRNYAPLAFSPGWLLGQLSEMFMDQESETDRFCTVFYLKANTRTCVVEYARGGHELPIWYHARTEEISLVEGGGVVAGMVEGSEYDTFKISLEPGDKLVFYTDGITDIKSPDGTRWHREGLENTIAAQGNLSPEKLREAIVREINRFRGDVPYPDDLTLVILEVTS